MNQDEIRAKREEAEAQLKRAKLDYALATGAPKGVLAMLETICRHPRGYETSCMGDRGFRCPDCGYVR